MGEAVWAGRQGETGKRRQRERQAGQADGGKG